MVRKRCNGWVKGERRGRSGDISKVGKLFEKYLAKYQLTWCLLFYNYSHIIMEELIFAPEKEVLRVFRSINNGID